MRGRSPLKIRVTRRLQAPLVARLGLLVLMAALPSCAEPGPPALELVAASSLADLASHLAEGFEARTGQRVTVRLGSSSTLSRQLDMGGPGDVFLSADEQWVSVLDTVEKGSWLGNRLAWVVPADGPDIAPGEATSLAMAAEGVPLGRYAREALLAKGFDLPERVVRGSHARATLAIVSSGAVSAGVVYATDAALDAGVRVVALWDGGDARPLRYVAALLRPEGRPLYDALQAPWMLDRADELGFVVLR